MNALPRNRLLAGVLAASVGLAACDTPADSPVEPDLAVVQGWERSSFDVYSQNLFLGGDTGPLFDPDVIANPVALVEAVNAFWSAVQDSDVEGRMAMIAHEIALQNPEVVGVQEGLQFVTLDANFQFNGQGFIDVLAALQGAIADEQLPYELEVVRSTTSSALPMAIDFTADPRDSGS